MSSELEASVEEESRAQWAKKSEVSALTSSSSADSNVSTGAALPVVSALISSDFLAHRGMEQGA